MDLHDRLFDQSPDGSDDERWAASGAMALTGPSDGKPLLPPRSLMPFLVSLGCAIEDLTARLGGRVALDTPALLGERAAIAGLRRQGRRSCGGASELLRCADDWIAVALARPDDVELLPVWLGTTDVAAAIAERRASDLIAAAIELGVPCARLGEVEPSASAVTARRVSTDRSAGRLDDALVVDLSGLWAGPLCGHVLTAAGARTVKVESISRPDGARFGPPAFYDLLHAGQESVALDFRDAGDLQLLRRLLTRADVVIEASRPRALTQLGIDRHAICARSGTVWVAITGYGSNVERVAFGDDAAVAGGLIAGSRDAPMFCADAVADPLAGLTAAAFALDCLAAGGGWFIDVRMAAVAAWCARLPASVSPWAGTVGAPRARAPAGRAPELGRDNDRVLRELAA